MTAPVFSFDDGPSEWTLEILDLLAEHHARGFFFVTGSAAEGREDIVYETFRGGHEVGVHGWGHRRLTELTDNEIRWELGDTQSLLESVTGHTPTLFRAPFFAVDERVLAIAGSVGLSHFGADVVPEDWMATDPEALAAKILGRLNPGAVVSLHDGVPPDGGSSHCTDSRAVTVEALRMVLEQLAVKA